MMKLLAEKKLSSSLEDYLEAIYHITSKCDVARSKDIAKMLNVAKPSVTSAVKLLSVRGLVNYKPYGYVTLTEGGYEIARSVAGKHKVIESFFINVLGLDSETARTSACKTEHALGPEVVKKLLYLTEFLQGDTVPAREFTIAFNNFLKQKNLDEYRNDK